MHQFIGRIDSWRAKWDYWSLKALPRPIRNGLLRYFWNQHVVNQEKMKVPVKTLSNIIREQKVTQVDLLKVRPDGYYSSSTSSSSLPVIMPPLTVIVTYQVDIEGYEYQALLGIEKEHWPMVKRVFLDLESNGMKWKEIDSEATPYSNQVLLYAWRE